jgi:hypothetical protein
LKVSNIVSLVGSWGILARLLFIVRSLIVGLFLRGREPGTHNVTGLRTAQRNDGAAILVTTQDFAGTATLPFVLVGGILLLLVLLPTAKRSGARVSPSGKAAGLPRTRVPNRPCRRDKVTETGSVDLT